MALHKLFLTFKNDQPKSIAREWSLAGIVRSRDLEVLMEKKALNGAVEVEITTPMEQPEMVWQGLIEKFVSEHHLGDVLIGINDNNSNPSVANMRLSEALTEANKH